MLEKHFREAPFTWKQRAAFWAAFLYYMSSAALLLTVRALARAEGVEDTLLAEWALSQPSLPGRSLGSARSATAKGWRWIAEMEEVSGFASGNPETKDIYAAVARFYQHIARDFDGAQADVSALKAFVGKGQKDS